MMETTGLAKFAQEPMAGTAATGAIGAPRDVGELIQRCNEAEQINVRVSMLNERLNHICDALFGAAGDDKPSHVKPVSESAMGRLSAAHDGTAQALVTAESLVERLSRLI